MILIDREKLDQIMTPERAVQAVKEAFLLYSSGKITQPLRQTMIVKGNWWGVMPSLSDNAFVVKVVNVIEANRERGLPPVQAGVLVFSPDTGEPLAYVDGTALTAVRTAAASVLSTELCYGRKVGTLGIIGAGLEAEYHAKIALGYLSVSRLLITARKRHFELAKRVGGEAVELERLLKESDVVFSLTSSKTPVVIGKLLKEDFHVSSIGAYTPDARELDDDVIRRVRTYVVDSLEAVSKESGDFIQPKERGLLEGKRVVEIGRLLAEGGRVERPSLFKTVGIAAQDNVTAYYAYKYYL
ncbi:MAG: ornithine cyclodeaminase family protein [Candidatus Aramenus sulfurataquae]|jgi:alanine dehydrogenase|uniref:Ornithine cyclodeaminase n=2 Tax=Candidatus Aramenus sulfurataquae TaxID=1326980 RepID=A0A0F2LLF3_9CREN|nr:ornithine cyclodeaminase family protein [Candidatus Aramenus sulfurataquae]